MNVGDDGNLHPYRLSAPAPRSQGFGGGVVTIRQYLTAGLIDEMHLAYRPALLGTGESLLTNLDLKALGYDVVSFAMSSACMHVQIAKTNR